MATGLCIGASTVSAVQLSSASDKGRPVEILRCGTYPHEGDPKRTLAAALADFSPSDGQRVAVTGRRFRHCVDLSSISEPEAVSIAYRHAKPPGVDCPAIVSAGGETFMVYVLDDAGHIANVITGNKCASGTGEFFLQQLRRMNVTLEEVLQWSADEPPYAVSGRCSVFCKSDCTHATNKGIPRSRVAAGLCRMMAEKILDLLPNIPQRHIMLVGGVARNAMVVAHLRRHIHGLIIPSQAAEFEALGAALWAIGHPTQPYRRERRLFFPHAARFDRLAPLTAYRDRVTFKDLTRGSAHPGDICILGLDVGSTTTKAVLIRTADEAILASVYLRTDGDPVGASRKCYAAIRDHIASTTQPESLTIVGLGVCGSGRQIAGVHAATDGVINEIIAHCTAAVHFDPEVDTLFEIGGQDAKYTHITGGVASDYAMNEACSAGTGSFLEESALETLGIRVEEIADIALSATHPPNFNDQCAAFIAADIKTAIHEGVDHADIVAGLVYSICMNYTNRVKGNRPTGRRIFMQGGVCYNRAVPLAMAALVGKRIVVPPEPGLMGAFGVALEVNKRLRAGLMSPAAFDLDRLADREVVHVKRFICKGEGHRCDRKCEIALIQVDGQRIPFGGACNRYYNLHKRIRVDADALDMVKQRQTSLWADAEAETRRSTAAHGLRIGINRSFLFHTYYPLYASFFTRLGVTVCVPATPSRRGMAQRGAAFCYPAELSHGFFRQLIDSPHPPDYLFLPHFKSLPCASSGTAAWLCPLVQSEPYVLRTTFRRRLQRAGITPDRVLAPIVDLSAGLASVRAPLIDTAMAMGLARHRAATAADHAIAVQQHFADRMKEGVAQALAALVRDPRRIGIVIFGRPYNAFADEAHMGIPRKLASRGVLVLPVDGLPVDGWPTRDRMYWGMGQRILRAAHMVAAHPQLFGVYISNFSCGPDSFLIGYFRDAMGEKPSLTLELDSHTADAGLETRIEAFLDVVAAWRQLHTAQPSRPPLHRPRPARIHSPNGVPGVITSSGEWLPLTAPRVTLLFPSMGKLSSEAMAAAFAAEGIHSVAARPADEAILNRGRANTSCKECLPLILTTGTLLDYAEARPAGQVLVYFMATAGGPCRFGQYKEFMEALIDKHALENVALLSLDAENGYLGLKRRLHRRGWQSLVIADAMEDIRSMLLANAVDPGGAMAIFTQSWRQLMDALASDRPGQVDRLLVQAAASLKAIDLKQPVAEVPVIALVGEIYARRDGISRQFITERLAQAGFACRCAPIAEWIYYSDWLASTSMAGNGRSAIWQKWGQLLKRRSMRIAEARIKRTLAASGLIGDEVVDLDAVLRHARPHLSPDLAGEAILTVGSAMHDVAVTACGVIAVGPFGCMPNRIAEALLNEIMTPADKLAAADGNHRLRDAVEGMGAMPFLTIESDGSPLPQIIDAKLDAFYLRARRLHARMMAADRPGAMGARPTFHR